MRGRVRGAASARRWAAHLRRQPRRARRPRCGAASPPRWRGAALVDKLRVGPTREGVYTSLGARAHRGGGRRGCCAPSLECIIIFFISVRNLSTRSSPRVLPCIFEGGVRWKGHLAPLIAPRRSQGVYDTPNEGCMQSGGVQESGSGNWQAPARRTHQPGLQTPMTSRAHGAGPFRIAFSWRSASPPRRS